MNQFATMPLAIYELKKKNSKFYEFLKNLDEELKPFKLSLEILLFMPIQRLPRYLALLSSLKGFTSSAHHSVHNYLEEDDHGHIAVGGVIKQFKEIITELKMTTNQQEHDRIKKVLTILGSIEKGEGFMKKDRKYLYEGTLQPTHVPIPSPKKGKSKISIPYFFLFDDILLHCTIKKRIEVSTIKKFDLEDSAELGDILDVHTGTSEYSVVITWKSNQTWTLDAPSRKQRDMWIDKFNEALKQLRHK